MPNLNDMVRKLLFEDIESRLPELTRQFPEYDAELIKLIAASSDPSGDRCDYITWILRMMRKGDWSPETDVSIIRPLLTKFMTLRSNRNVWKTTTDIGQYKSVEELEKAVKLAENSQQFLADEKFIKDCKSDQRRVTEQGGYRLMYLPTVAAAVGAAFGTFPKPTPEESKAVNYNSSRPLRSAKWCTANYNTAASYLEDGKLYAIFSEDQPLYQVFFAKSGTDRISEIKTTANGEPSDDELKVIAPLFAGDYFKKLFAESQAALNVGFSPAKTDVQYTKQRIAALTQKQNSVPRLIVTINLSTLKNRIQLAKAEFYQRNINGYTDKITKVVYPARPRSQIPLIDKTWIKMAENFRRGVTKMITQRSEGYGRFVNQTPSKLYNALETRINSLRGTGSSRSVMQSLYDLAVAQEPSEQRVYNPEEDKDLLERTPEAGLVWPEELTDPDKFLALMIEADNGL